MALLYLEPFGGIAGDMLLAALLDLGDPRFTLRDLSGLAAALVGGECTLRQEEVRRGSFRAIRLVVTTPESARPPHRHLADLVALLAASPLGPRARARAAAVLERIARAEARVHGAAIEDVHFHEVGAVDTLIDAGGAALALERLGVEEVRAAVPYVGGGRIAGAHGPMPVPAPGTAEILRGTPVVHGPGGERVTPTGAALLVELAREVGAPFSLQAAAIGYGAGARDPAEGPPNLLRVQLGAGAGDGPAQRSVLELAINLDDASGEEVSFLVEALRQAGALDAWCTPVLMKKGRPGVVVSALARPENRSALERAAFAHSPTLGVRWSPAERTELLQETIEVELAGPLAGERVRVKVRRPPEAVPGSSPRDLSPEHDDLARLSRATGRPLRELEALVREALRRRGTDRGEGSGVEAGSRPR
ncbi:MAG: nickel pincer cofactor biosynthesis protein LarC [Planctomycetota bacterium]